ncbi:MAG: class I SAM-dependent methyltransferase [Betaproteobacteria bacterium]|nr:class I SAM-dependent methyltransferase [Betaproteobacteria bacterium]
MTSNSTCGSDDIAPPWLEVLIRSLSTKQYSPLGEILPEFPSNELQANTTGLSAEATLRQAHAFYQDVDCAMRSVDRELNANSKILDFGFGWGRISRTFMEKASIRNIHGVDVDPSFVDITRELFHSDNFEVCAPFPPIECQDASFDLVVAYSVFSHLSEKACIDWMGEFARIVKPGGIVAWTTRHESFFDYCAWARKQGNAVNGYLHALGQLFPDVEAPRTRYRNGELVHVTSEGVGGGEARGISFYGETWIPERYVRTQFSKDFSLIASYFDGSRYDQSCFVLQRK